MNTLCKALLLGVVLGGFFQLDPTVRDWEAGLARSLWGGSDAKENVDRTPAVVGRLVDAEECRCGSPGLSPSAPSNQPPATDASTGAAPNGSSPDRPAESSNDDDLYEWRGAGWYCIHLYQDFSADYRTRSSLKYLSSSYEYIDTQEAWDNFALGVCTDEAGYGQMRTADGARHDTQAACQAAHGRRLELARRDRESREHRDCVLDHRCRQ